MELDFKKLVETGILPADYISSPDPDRLIRIVIKPDDICSLVARDPGRKQSQGYMGNHMHGARTSRQVEPHHRWTQYLTKRTSS